MKTAISWGIWGVCVALAGCVATAPNVVEAPVLKPQPRPEPRLEPKPEVLVPIAAPPAPPVMTQAPPPMRPRALAAPPPDPQPRADVAATEPVVRQRRYPDYPAALVQEGLKGQVIASFVVGAEGRPEDVRIERSTHPLFSKAVTDALKGWRFDPARSADGRVVPTRMKVPFRFQLE